jgi:hypothetical protein
MYISNDVVIDGQYHNMETLRRRAADYLPNLLSKYFIKCILIKGKPTFTYDFDGFLFHDLSPEKRTPCYKTNTEIPRWFFQFEKYCFDDQVYPVVGLSSDTHSSEAGVDQIYRAIRKNFILVTDIKKNDKGKHQGHVPIETQSGRDISRSTALTIYCGLVKMHDFSGKEAMELIGASPEDFADNWRWFKEEIRTAIKPDENITDEKRDKARRFYAKTLLTLNYLRNHIPYPYVSLNQLAY